MKASMGVAAMLLAATLAGCARSPAKSAREGYREVTREGQLFFCRTETVTGSRVSVRETCLTRKQMEQAEAQAQDDLRRMQSPGFEPDLPDTEMGAY